MDPIPGMPYSYLDMANNSSALIFFGDNNYSMSPMNNVPYSYLDSSILSVTVFFLGDTNLVLQAGPMPNPNRDQDDNLIFTVQIMPGFNVHGYDAIQFDVSNIPPDQLAGAFVSLENTLNGNKIRTKPHIDSATFGDPRIKIHLAYNKLDIAINQLKKALDGSLQILNDTNISKAHGHVSPKIETDW